MESQTMILILMAHPNPSYEDYVADQGYNPHNVSLSTQLNIHNAPATDPDSSSADFARDTKDSPQDYAKDTEGSPDDYTNDTTDSIGNNAKDDVDFQRVYPADTKALPDASMDSPDDIAMDIPDAMMDRYYPIDPALGGRDLSDYPGNFEGVAELHGFHGLEDHGHEGYGITDGTDEHDLQDGTDDDDIHDGTNKDGIHDGTDEDAIHDATHEENIHQVTNDRDITEESSIVNEGVHTPPDTSSVPLVTHPNPSTTDRGMEPTNNLGDERLNEEDPAPTQPHGIQTQERHEPNSTQPHVPTPTQYPNPYTIPDDAIRPWEHSTGHSAHPTHHSGLPTDHSGHPADPSGGNQQTPHLVESNEPTTPSGIPSKDRVPEGEEHLFGAYVHPSEIDKLSELFDESTNDASSDDKFGMYVPTDETLEPDHYYPQIHELWPGLETSNKTDPPIDVTKDGPVAPIPSSSTSSPGAAYPWMTNAPNPRPPTTQSPGGIQTHTYDSRQTTQQHEEGKSMHTNPFTTTTIIYPASTSLPAGVDTSAGPGGENIHLHPQVPDVDHKPKEGKIRQMQTEIR